MYKKYLSELEQKSPGQIVVLPPCVGSRPLDQQSIFLKNTVFRNWPEINLKLLLQGFAVYHVVLRNKDIYSYLVLVQLQ